MVLGRQTITFATRKARVSAAEVLPPCARVAVPGAGPTGPKLTQSGPRCLRGEPQKGPFSELVDSINLGTVWVAFWPCLDPWGPETVSAGPRMGLLEPRVCPAG